MRLFVPGRICLFGEHTDWAGGYRRINGALEKGYTIIAGTNQGVYANVRPHPQNLVLRSHLNDGRVIGPYEVPMEREALYAEALKGGFFSYAAGVAYQVLTHYRVRGLEIDNDHTDLPIKKGLSSSAAICVLVARAFNRLYDLKMTVRGEMEYAYRGEITTPSRCGRMDQGCAFGNRPVLMIFDGDQLEVRELTVGRDLYFVIVDLKAGKDTREILNRLNHCYPFAENDLERGVQEYLGPLSASITQEAAEALRAGDACRVGQLMTKAQALFDRYVMPACPSQLTAPVLHGVLAHPALQPHVWGGKGVGSQGDGSAQFICRSAEDQEAVLAILERELGMSGLKLTLHAARRVRKAVIPAAGFGTRLFPATKAVKKELFPVVGRDGVCRPALLAIVEEAAASGMEEIAIVVQENDRRMFEEFFMLPPPVENFNKLSAESRRISQQVLELGRRVTLLTQREQEGFGHAVYCAREWVGEEPFLLLLGDHLFDSEAEETCTQQILSAYDRYRVNVVGLMPTREEEVHLFGCATGLRQSDGALMLTELTEKPDAEYARQHLRVEGLPEGSYYGFSGQYVLSPKVFDHLGETIRRGIRQRGEFQLTPCLDRLRQEEGFIGLPIRGRRYDIGTPVSYRQTVLEYGNV